MGKIIAFPASAALSPATLAYTRTLIADEIERLIGLLDALDTDPDLEPDADGEPWLANFGSWGDAGDDRELDDGERGQ